ncbi:unnamed protein product [Candidula unifasciata]|uniref:ER-bound oxygenase mpaB/mpaB'/Rubber oxygenase catalytic domain-containing protein n=1 Tax=Candidula unifasciata TaxID=100452 RepID=A0A8S4A6D2_9EUPU|nr:unnamed protein product [Candidula unifasciata]
MPSPDDVIGKQLPCELRIKDLECGRLLDGDCAAELSPPDEFDMARFHRGRMFFRDHLFSCSIAMYFSLVIGMSVPEFLEALVFTQQSDTPVKAFRRYIKTFHHVALWHYGNIWEKDSKAQKSICDVRQIHKVIREQMQKRFEGREVRKFISQYDMGVVLSGFMGAVIMYPEDAGIRCSLDELDDYVYFWYGVGHLLGIEKKYNICAHGLTQALTFCKSIEQDIVKKNITNPPPEFQHVTENVIKAFQGGRGPMSLLTFPVISALSYEYIVGDSGKLSFPDTVRYLIWKLIFFTVKHVSWFRIYLNQRIERACRLTFINV